VAARPVPAGVGLGPCWIFLELPDLTADSEGFVQFRLLEIRLLQRFQFGDRLRDSALDLPLAFRREGVDFLRRLCLEIGDLLLHLLPQPGRLCARGFLNGSDGRSGGFLEIVNLRSSAGEQGPGIAGKVIDQYQPVTHRPLQVSCRLRLGEERQAASGCRKD